MVFQKKQKRPTGARRGSQPYTFIPPVRGLILDEPLVNSKAGGARILENIFPLKTTVRLRRGSRKYATISTGPVQRMFRYKSGQAEQFFASDAENIFEITTVADPDVIPTAAVSGQTSGYYSTAQIGTAGGDNYLYAVNGTDDALLFDGSTWMAINGASTPAITGIATDLLVFVWLFASRLFFIEKDSMSVWFLPVDSIGGAAQEFSLAGVFQKGGHLVTGGKWSLDAGDGLDDKWVVISSEGEVAVFQGTNPGSAADWQKVGVYEITSPLGPNATMQAGGDLLVAVQDGMVPISEAVNKDAAALSLSAITKHIEPLWKSEVLLRSSMPWEVMKWAANNMMIVSLPAIDVGLPPLCLVANLETGAWCSFTGWDTRCLGQFENLAFFGTSDGTIHEMEVGGSDDGIPYVCTYVGLPDTLKSPAISKIMHFGRATFLSSTPFKVKVSVSTNYAINLPTAPSSVPDFHTDKWDVGLWDVAVWDAAGTMTVSTKLVSLGRSGFAVSPQIQVTSGTEDAPSVELVSFDVIYEQGGMAV